MTTSASHSTAVDGLAELARHVRQSTLDLLLVPHVSWLTWAPRGTSNHILWHAGHALWLQDALTIRPLTGRSDLPNGWEKTFGQNSRPEKTAEWPDEAEVRARLQSQLTRIRQVLGEQADSILSNANRKSRDSGWPLLPGMIHGWHDEGRHQGEMYLLQKLLHTATRQLSD